MKSGTNVVGRHHGLVTQHNVAGRQRRGQLSMIAVVLPLIAACTTTSSPPTSVTTSAAPPTTHVATSPGERPGVLSCADAYTTEPRGPKPAFTASGVAFEALNEAGFDPVPAAGSTGLPADAAGYLSKSPIYLDNGVTWAEVTAIKGDITFAWVPARVWTTASGWSLATYEAKTARFDSCNGSYTGFLGAVHTPSAHACITLGVRSNRHPSIEPIRVAIGKGSCP